MRWVNWLVCGLGAGALVSGAMAGCGSSEGDSDDTSSSGSSVQNCAPPAECSDVVSECVALVDNKDNPKPGLRISQLSIKQPPALAAVFVSNLIQTAVLLDRQQCYLDGDGTFTWILQFDPATGMLRTGGAKPGTPEEGYCFVNETLDGVEIAPIEIDVGLEGGKFSAEVGKNVNVPIYRDTTGSNYVLLPLRNARILDGTISSDFNCIGKHNSDGLKTVDECRSTTDIPAFVDGARLEGHITLEEADTVVIDELGKSLCALLAGADDEGKPVARCIREAEVIAYKGDWCDETNSAGGCADSVVLGAGFAASAVKVNGDCN